MNKIKRISAVTFSSLQIYNFKLYFVGQTLSMSGTWMQSVAQAILLLELTGSGTALGILIAAQFLPILLLGSFGGVIADRFSKRRILMVTQAVAGLLAFIQGIIIYLDIIQIWMLYGFAIGLGITTAFENPAKQAFIFEMVGKNHIKNAVSLNSSMINLARILGPALAAILIPTVGIAACFAINGISFGAVLIVLLLMKKQELHPAEHTNRIKGQLMEGLRYINNSPTLKNVLIMLGIIGTFTFEFGVILPLFARFTFHNGTDGFALLSAALGLGAAVGGLYAASRRRTSMKAIIISSFFFGLAVLSASLAPTLNIAALLMLIVGFFSINFLSLANSLLQIKSEPEMRGRVMSLWAIAFLGSTPIGGPIIGWIGEAFSPRWGLAVGGFAALFACALAILMVRRDQEHIIPEEVQTEHTHIISDKPHSLR